MTVPSLPDGFDEAHHIQASRTDCHITVGFDQHQQHVPRFLVQLHYQVEVDPVRWAVIARMDHNETSSTGHDVYQEGLHVDVDRQAATTVHLDVPHSPLPRNRGTVIRASADYLQQEAEYFIRVFTGDQSPGGPPQWRPDGGEPTRTLISLNLLDDDMSQESSAEEPLSLDELSEELAEATGTTAEEIEQGADDIEIGRPWEGDVVDTDE